MIHGITPQEVFYALILTGYVIIVVYGGRKLYSYVRGKGKSHEVAVYYTRKYIHVFAGGVIAVLTPFLFTTPLLPFLMALALTGFLYFMRKTGRLMWWFQIKENAYEVNFTIAWGVSLIILWMATGDPNIAVLPGIFIAFGDAVTGVVRNMLFEKRTKHWAGNIAMATVSVPLGFLYAGSIGAFAGLIASAIEKFEFPPLDDNILVAISTMIILLLAA
ncbi:MAG: dolichol kinase [Desulfurococcales archaeon]|nr:dolichol kinase [Desulfurococcales archaeon]